MSFRLADYATVSRDGISDAGPAHIYRAGLWQEGRERGEGESGWMQFSQWEKWINIETSLKEILSPWRPISMLSNWSCFASVADFFCADGQYQNSLLLFPQNFILVTFWSVDAVTTEEVKGFTYTTSVFLSSTKNESSIKQHHIHQVDYTDLAKSVF